MKTIIFFLMLSIPMHAWASSTGMPWEGPMNQILNSLTGPWLRFGSVVAIMSAGLALALGETSGFLKKMIMLVLGLSIACAASGWGLSFFGFAGGFCF
ncbi:MAG: type IV secretion system protein VirB2 [Candidatus Magnetoglobus multicellularis str. Araruama]|uniref:Type IV secretion system protein VirB2 n=1 Tax=Candidatus Magnetoglobus multicellularis str. Araruama TaxID=890399 RepID=A0A1V1PHD4_9BACT|nr:MAG: type IV secretion system protein VirB2 [Candidatus Magnetoglobus multicellularis str. Araruama]